MKTTKKVLQMFLQTSSAPRLRETPARPLDTLVRPPRDPARPPLDPRETSRYTPSNTPTPPESRHQLRPPRGLRADFSLVSMHGGSSIDDMILHKPSGVAITYDARSRGHVDMYLNVGKVARGEYREWKSMGVEDVWSIEGVPVRGTFRGTLMAASTKESYVSFQEEVKEKGSEWEWLVSQANSCKPGAASSSPPQRGPQHQPQPISSPHSTPVNKSVQNEYSA